MKKLNIEHLAPYLPYNLRLLELRKGKFNGDEDVQTTYIMNNGNITYPLRDKTYRVIWCKPILRTIYEIKELMPEFLKEASLFDCSEFEFDIQGNITTDGYVYVNAMRRGVVIDSLSYDGNLFYSMDNNGDMYPTNPQFPLQQLIYKFHLDQFGLIDAGLAIDINTLQK